MIYAILSRNFAVRIYALFRRFLWTEKLNSADVILFWMYGCCIGQTQVSDPLTVKRGLEYATLMYTMYLYIVYIRGCCSYHSTRLKLLDWTQVSDPECTQLEAAVSKTASHMFKCNHVGMIKLYTFYVAFYTFHWLKCPKLH